MGEHTSELTQENFDKQISKGNWIVDFWAEWCGPCRVLGPIIDETAKAMKGKVKFGKVNVDEQQDLAGQFEVMSIPTLIYFKDGEIVNRAVGVMEKEEIEDSAKDAFDL